MKTRIILAAVFLTLAGAGFAYAAYTNVMTFDFQGTVCDDGQVVKQEGKWRDVSGSTFQGYTSVTKGEKKRFEKKGRLESPTFSGEYDFLEVKEPNYRQTTEVTRGREILPSGGSFWGQKQVITFTDGKVETSKSGTMDTPTFHGRYEYFELKEPGQEIRFREDWEGKEVLPDGGIFEGKKHVEKNDNFNTIRTCKNGTISSAVFNGSYSRDDVSCFEGNECYAGYGKHWFELRDGEWSIAPDYKLVGDLRAWTDPDNGDKVRIIDNRREETQAFSAEAVAAKPAALGTDSPAVSEQGPAIGKAAALLGLPKLPLPDLPLPDLPLPNLPHPRPPLPEPPLPPVPGTTPPLPPELGRHRDEFKQVKAAIEELVPEIKRLEKIREELAKLQERVKNEKKELFDLRQEVKHLQSLPQLPKEWKGMPTKQYIIKSQNRIRELKFAILPGDEALKGRLEQELSRLPGLQHRKAELERRLEELRKILAPYGL